MQRPWTADIVDEWLPRSLRLCWGDGSGDSSGGGPGGSGGFGDYGTGGGDWGSAGAVGLSGYDANAFGGDPSAGWAIDAAAGFGQFGTGPGEWYDAGPYNAAGLNASDPNATGNIGLSAFDLAGTQPGVSTGPGDWGSAGGVGSIGGYGSPASYSGYGGDFGGGNRSSGAYASAMADYGGSGMAYGGGPAYGGGYGGGGAFSGGGPFGDYTSSPGGGGGGGGRSGSSGGRGSGGGASNFGGQGGGRSYAGSPSASPGWEPDLGGGGKSEVTDPYADDTGPEGRGEQEGPPAEPPSDLGPSDFGKPAEPPSQQDTAPEPSGGRDREATPETAASSAFGPQAIEAAGQLAADRTDYAQAADIVAADLSNSGVNWDAVFGGTAPEPPPALGLNDIVVGPGPGLGINTGILGMNTGTLSQPAGFGSGPGFAATGLEADLGKNDIKSSPTNMPGVNWDAVFEGAAAPEAPDITDWGSVFEGAAPPYDPLGTPFETPTSTDNTYTLGGDPALSGYSADPSARGEVFEGAPSSQNVDWDKVFEGAPSNQNVDWDKVFEGAPSNQNVDWDKVFEGAAPAPPSAPYEPTTQAGRNAAIEAGRQQAVIPEGVTAAEYNAAIDKFAALDAAAAAKNAEDAAAFDAADKANQDKAPGSTTPPGITSSIPGDRYTDFDYTRSTQDPVPGLIDMAQRGVPMPQARPSEAPVQPGVPMPQARPAEAPSTPTTARSGPFVGIIDKRTAAQAEEAGKAADTGRGPTVPVNPNTGMPAMNALNVRGGSTRTSAPTTIVTHFTGGKGYTIGSLVSQMAKGGAGYSYAVDKSGKVYQLRPDDRTAGHVGPGKGNIGGIKNANSIGVAAIAENESDLTPAQIASMKDVVAALGRQFGISPSDVHGHAVVSPGRRGGGEGSTVAGWSHGLTSWKDAPTSRPPADIPGRTQQAEVQPAPQPPADIPPPEPEQPVNLPPTPPVDIPAPAPFLEPPARGRADPKWQAERAQSILKDATAHLNKDSGQAAFQAASVVAAKALAAAGIPLNMARSLMTKGALDGAIANGYGPGGPNSTVMGFSIWGKVQSAIADGINTALQGYNPAATGPTPQGGRYGPGPVQGPYGFQPDAPAAPGKRSELPGSLLNLISQFNPISTAEARGSRSSTPKGATPSNPHFTFYAPGAGGKMEGKFETSRPNQAGVNVPVTLDMVRAARDAGRDLAVTLASDPSRYGDTIAVGTVTYVSPIDGKTYTLDNVQGYVHDTGSAFKGRPDKVDIATSDYTGWSPSAAQGHVANNFIGAPTSALAAQPQAEPVEARAEGGDVRKGRPYLVGEEGPEYFVPDEPGTILPHMPQPGKGNPNIGRWPKAPAPDVPGRYRGLEGAIKQQTVAAQDLRPSLMDLIDSGRLRLNAANWQRMISDPHLIALGQSHIRDISQPGDYGSWDLPAYDQTPNELSRQLGYDAIRRPLPRSSRIEDRR